MGNAMSSSFAPECTEAKKQYDDCFNNWYTESECSDLSVSLRNGKTNKMTEFLKGKSLYNECDDLWHDYKACVDVSLIPNLQIQKKEELTYLV